MKNLPNIITFLRIGLSISLLFLEPTSIGFLCIYGLCGFSDMLDGYIARKFKLSSRFGARLDSIADIMMFLIVGIRLTSFLIVPPLILVWILLIAFIRIVSLAIVFIKYRTFVILHTYGNKLTGFMLFLIPFILNLIDMSMLGMIVCTIATIAALEELFIHITSKDLNPDHQGIIMKLFKPKQKESL